MCADYLPARNVVITADGTHINYSWDYQPGSDAALTLAGTFAILPNNYMIMPWAQNGIWAPQDNNVMEVKKGAPYAVQVAMCYPPPADGAYTCVGDYSELIVPAEVAWDSTATTGGGKVGEKINVRISAWPTDPDHSWLARAFTDYDETKNIPPKDAGFMNATVNYYKNDGSLGFTRVYKSKWIVDSPKSYSDVYFYANQPGIYVVNSTVKLDKALYYRYREPGTGVWTYRSVRTRLSHARPSRVRVWIPAQYRSADTIRVKKVFSVR